MSERDALLAAILANPDDELSRLVYADWLEETAAPVAVARARFIRLQIELANNDRDAHDFPHRNFDLAQELDSLASRWLRAWLTELPVPVANAVWKQRLGASAFRRGFVDGVKLGPEVFMRTALALFAAAPITALHFHGGYSDINSLLACLHLHKLRSIRLSGGWAGDRIARRLTKPTTLGAVRELDLSGCALTDSGALDLARAEVVGQLTVFRARSNRLTGFGVHVLASTSVARLDVTGNPGVSGWPSGVIERVKF